MEEKFELLEQVHHDSSMAAYTIEKLLDKLKDKDNKIKAYAEEILKEYQQFEEEARVLLKEGNKEPSDPSLMAKMGSSMGISKEVNDDNSDSAMADMLIQGISMGSIEIEKKLKEYETVKYNLDKITEKDRENSLETQSEQQNSRRKSDNENIELE